MVHTLLAHRMDVGFGAVLNLDADLVLALLEALGDVGVDGGVATHVAGRLGAVHKYLAVAVDASAVQQYAPLEILGGNVEGALIGQFGVFAHGDAYTREGALQRERNQYLAAGVAGREIPESIEIDPVRTYHLGPGIFGQHIVHIQVLTPFGKDPVSSGSPFDSLFLLSARGEGHQQGQRKHNPFHMYTKNKRSATKLIFYFEKYVRSMRLVAQ